MASDFRKHLASELVSEHKTVSYRTLARAAKVHVNAAKCMLYDFYEEQNKRKPGSAYATYLIAGTKKPAEPLNGTTKSNGAAADEDEPMPSSPPIPSSSMPAPPQQQSSSGEREVVKVRTVTLVREENLEGKRRPVFRPTRLTKSSRNEERIRNHHLPPHLQPLPRPPSRPHDPHRPDPQPLHGRLR
jgi:hypothetical protein